MTHAIDPRFQPFLPLATEGRIYVEYNDFVVPEWQDVTFDLTPASPDHVARPLNNLYVFGHVVFKSDSVVRPILKFLNVFVFGTLEVRGVNLWTKRLITMTIPQMGQGIASIIHKSSRKAPPTTDLCFSPLRNQSLRFTNDIDQKIYRGITNLIWAVQSNDQSLAKLLIHAKADLEIRCSGWTALGWAAQNRYMGIIKALIHAGADTESVAQQLCREGHSLGLGLLRNLQCRIHVIKVMAQESLISSEEKQPPST